MIIGYFERFQEILLTTDIQSVAIQRQHGKPFHTTPMTIVIHFRVFIGF